MTACGNFATTPRLPITLEIIGTTLGSAISMRQFCCSCMSEGGYVPTGKRLSVATSAGEFTMATAGTKYIIAAIRPQSSYPTATLRAIHYCGAYAAGNSRTIKIELQLHSTNGSIGSTSGTLSYSNFTDSGSQYAIGDGSQTVSADGYIISSDITTAQSSVTFHASDTEMMLTRAICTKYDTIYLIATGSANTMDVSGAIDVIESI